MMKYLVFLFPFICFAQIDDKTFDQHYNKLESQQLTMSTNYFQSLVEYALVLRSKTLRFHNEYEKLKEHDLPLSGSQIERMAAGMRHHLDLRQKLFKIVDHFADPILHKERQSLLNEENQLKSAMLAFSAALVLYDNYALSIAVMEEDDQLRRLVNKENSAFGIDEGAFSDVIESYHSVEKRQQIRQAQEFLETHHHEWKDLAKKDRQMAYLKTLIEQSPSYQKIAKDSSVRDYARYLGLLAQRGEDRVSKVNKESSHLVSKAFGNSVGLVQTRNGKLYKKPRVTKSIAAGLKPLDVLLEKTPFRLTDKFIPGHFGHVAVWLGTEAELRELGLWNSPIIKPHQSAIRQGNSVLEALRPGVELNSLNHFLNVDDMAVLRLKKWPQGEQQKALKRAFQQVGKDYDFNFDVETIDRIVCSEIVYHIYTHLKWPTERTLGRSTISPDNVAVKALKKREFEVVDLYLEGSEIADKVMKKRYGKLFAKEEGFFKSIPKKLKFW